MFTLSMIYKEWIRQIQMRLNTAELSCKTRQIKFVCNLRNICMQSITVCIAMCFDAKAYKYPTFFHCIIRPFMSLHAKPDNSVTCMSVKNNYLAKQTNPFYA